MHCSIRIERSAERELARIWGPQRRRIVAAIDQLAAEPLAGSPLKGSLRGPRRIRVGDYRVVYELLDAERIVLAVRVAHQREAHRRD